MLWRANSGSGHDFSGPDEERDMTKKKKRLALIASSLTLVGIAVALVLFALRDSVSLFASPSEIAAKALPSGARVRIGGLVKDGSLARDGSQIHFTVTDSKNDVAVTYDLSRYGALPDLFREGQGVVAEGTLGQEGLTASQILAKHDERYMPREVVDALKKSGVWQEGQGMPVKSNVEAGTSRQ
jgi:cytochrome c-type biogenesis protein CcmE